VRFPVPNLSFAALILLGTLAGCAAPQYVTNLSLTPPADSAGRTCVQDCEIRKTACQADCQTRYQACAKSLEPQVEASYVQALQQYELDLKRYAAALRHYEMQLHFGWMHGFPYHYPYFWWDPWPGPYFLPPYPEPAMPTREGVRAHLEKSACDADCGCPPAYEACFVGCGGQVVRETVCIKHCPPEK